MKHYLITGGAGFLGSPLVHALVRSSAVTVLDDLSRGTKNRLADIKGACTFIAGDIRDPRVVRRACRNVDSIIHLAYVNGTNFFYEKPDVVLDVGVKGMVNVLDGARNAGVKELFLASSSEVYHEATVPTPEDVPLIIPDPLNPRFSYAGGKIISELMAIHIGRTFLKRVVIFRPHNVYGPDMGREHVVPQLISRMVQLKRKKRRTYTLPIQGTGKQTRSFLYIDDFIRGLTLLLSRGKHMNIYNIGNPAETPVIDVVRTLATIMDMNVRVRPAKVPAGSVSRRCPDMTKLTKLGFAPEISLTKGLYETYAWYKKHV